MGQASRRRGARSVARALACGLGILALAAGPATAAGKWDRSGYYMAIFAAGGVDLAGEDLKPSPGLAVKLGYRHSGRFSTEVEGEWMQRFDADTGSGGIETWLATPNAKVYVLTGRIQPYALAGLGFFYMNDTRPGADGSSIGIGGKVGAGLEFYLNPDLLVGPEVRFNWTAGADETLRNVTVGLGMAFY